MPATPTTIIKNIKLDLLNSKTQNGKKKFFLIFVASNLNKEQNNVHNKKL